MEIKIEVYAGGVVNLFDNHTRTDKEFEDLSPIDQEEIVISLLTAGKRMLEKFANNINEYGQE